MARKRYKAEEIVAKLRQVDVLASQGQSMADAIRQIGVSEVTYYRWRQEFGGLKIEQGPTSGSMAECALPHPVQAATSLRMLIFSRRAFSASGSAADHSTSPPCNGRT
jgi:transposase-like protein